MSQCIAVIGLESHGSRAVFFGDPGAPAGSNGRRQLRNSTLLSEQASVVYQSRVTVVASRSASVELTPGHQLL